MSVDAEDLARWRAGDDAAGDRLVVRHHDLVRRLCAGHRPRRDGLDDLVQEAFLTMFARAHQYVPRQGTPFAHWLSRLTVNVCHDRVRAERRRPAMALSEAAAEWASWLHGTGATPADTLASHELADRLLSELAPRDRLLLTLLDGEGRSVAEIAALTGWGASLIKVRAFRARRRLRAIAEALGETGP